MTVAEYAAIASVLLSAATLLYVVLGNKNKVISNRFRKLEEAVANKVGSLEHAMLSGKVDLAEDRLTRVETDMKHLPDKDTAHKLELGLSELNGKVAALTEKLQPVTAMASRIQEAMIEKVTGT